jgi:hypothetical protein
MASISIDIPTSKVPLVKAAIEFHAGTETAMTNAEAVAWLQDKLERYVRQLVLNYQEHEYNKSFVADDPLVDTTP